MYLSVTKKFLDDRPWKSACQSDLLNQLEDYFIGADPSKLTEKRSNGIKKALNEFGELGEKAPHRYKWTRSVQLFPADNLKYKANFKATGRLQCADCSPSATVFVHLAVNNREAIGTTLLRSHLASVPEGGSGRLALIALGRDMLNLGGWDGVYGDADEIADQWALAYHDTISPGPAIIELNCPPLG